MGFKHIKSVLLEIPDIVQIVGKGPDAYIKLRGVNEVLKADAKKRKEGLAVFSKDSTELPRFRQDMLQTQRVQDSGKKNPSKQPDNDQIQQFAKECIELITMAPEYRIPFDKFVP